MSYFFNRFDNPFVIISPFQSNPFDDRAIIYQTYDYLHLYLKEIDLNKWVLKKSELQEYLNVNDNFNFQIFQYLDADIFRLKNYLPIDFALETYYEAGFYDNWQINNSKNFNFISQVNAENQSIRFFSLTIDYFGKILNDQNQEILFYRTYANLNNEIAFELVVNKVCDLMNYESHERTNKINSFLDFHFNDIGQIPEAFDNFINYLDRVVIDILNHDANRFIDLISVITEWKQKKIESKKLIEKLNKPPQQTKGFDLGLNDSQLTNLHKQLIDNNFIALCDVRHFINAFNGKELASDFVKLEWIDKSITRHQLINAQTLFILLYSFKISNDIKLIGTIKSLFIENIRNLQNKNPHRIEIKTKRQEMLINIISSV